jgi:hypothetical protein
MNYTGKQLKRVALKLKYVLVEGRKHTGYTIMRAGS